MLRLVRVAFVLLSAVPTFGQDDPPSEQPEAQEPGTEDETQQQAGPRQRQEGSDNEDVDVVETEADRAPEDVSDETVEFYVSLRVMTGSEGESLKGRRQVRENACPSSDWPEPEASRLFDEAFVVGSRGGSGAFGRAAREHESAWADGIRGGP